MEFPLTHTYFARLLRSGRTRPVALTLVTAIAAWLAHAAHAQCPTVFGGPTSFPVGGIGSRALVKADFNVDGLPDLAVVNNGSNTVSILLATGLGTFGASQNFAVGTFPVFVAAGDFNTDGNPDIAVTNANSNNISILLGTGTGSFGTATHYAVGANPFSDTVGDFNNDGNLDLVVTNSSTGNVSVLLGTGTGSFGAATNFAVGAQPRSVAVGDFNGDSKSDLVVVNQGNNNVSILLGTGTGAFGVATNFGVGISPWSVTVSDFNADGKLDLVVANINVTAAGCTVSILLGTGTGTFGAATNFAVGLLPRSVAVGDVNGDGKLDLVVANQSSANVSYLSGTGTGTFAPAINYPAGPTPFSVALEDFSGDGRLDVAVANFGNNTVSILVALPLPNLPSFSMQPGTQSVLVGASVSFTVAATSPQGGTTPTFQWRRNGVNLVNGGTISGATTQTLTISPADLSDNGSAIDCVVTNGCGSIVSEAGGLAVSDNCPADFNNDGSIDFFDYLDFVDAYSVGC